MEMLLDQPLDNWALVSTDQPTPSIGIILTFGCRHDRLEQIIVGGIIGSGDGQITAHHAYLEHINSPSCKNQHPDCRSRLVQQHLTLPCCLEICLHWHPE